MIKDTGENQLWRPRNDTKQFYGPTRLRMGLVKSRNLVSIRLLQATGIPYTLTYLQKFGFDPAEQPHSLSLALGSGSTTPLRLASAFAVLANGGYRVTPYYIGKITDADDKIVNQSNPALACNKCISNPNIADDAKPNPMAQRAITSQNAYLITQVLRGVIQQGTGRAAKVLKRTDLSGKTGTTNKQIDAWFSGYNNNIVTTVWIGFDDMHSVNEYGAQAALPIWIDFMQDALAGMPTANLPEPPGLISLRIDKETGLLVKGQSPNSTFELFRKQYAPTSYAAAVDSIRKTDSNSDTTTSDTDDESSNSDAETEIGRASCRERV